ncbi:uncharacterized protein TNCV_1503861 [Trichonephila clavipes]|uniref:Uncharacterized protein n=1 Tax=Trichonephila clavipes TaxID=2585209 RepID=A0A8X6RQR1_TRICX|nr:uncharacterized protein TNCV_1503861 [Trichonephila clavipes]
MEDDKFIMVLIIRRSPELWTITKFRKNRKEISRNINLQLFCELLDVIAATRGLLAKDHVILNHGQVTWTTPELAPSPNSHTTPTGEDVSALDRFNVHRCPTRRVFNGIGLELVARQATVRYLYHSATAAVRYVEG